MHEQHFDALTKTLGNESSSRRRALQVVGAALASAGLVAGFSFDATAGRAKRRCKNQGGVFLSEGECRCSGVCSNTFFGLDPCNGDERCRCMQTTGGRGVCYLHTGGFTSVDCICNGCPANQICIVLSGCPNSGRECVTTKECVTQFGTWYGCVNGRCEFTACVEPCPTQP